MPALGPVILLLVDAAVKSAFLLTATLVLTRGLARAPAVVRQVLWATALAGCLLIPALTPWLPPIHVGRVPLPAFVATAFTTTAKPSASGPSVAATRSARPVETPAGATLEGATAPRPRSDSSLPPATWFGLAWLAGLAAALGRQMSGLWRAARLTARAARLDSPGWRHDLALARRRVGVGRSVRLLISPHIAAPITWGARRPVILVPTAAAGWTHERRLIVLLHELVHVRRRDWLARVIARLACAVYWFDPLAWLAARRLTLEQEMACDEEVLALGTRPSTYAGHLLAITRSLALRPGPAAPVMAAVDMAGRTHMEGRLMRILETKPPRLARRLLVPAILSLTALVPALAAMRPWEMGGPTPDAWALSSDDAGGEGLAATGVEAPADLGRLLDRLGQLESALEPMERELEVLEARLEPIEAELEGVEDELEPAARQLEALEAELEPYERRLDEVESRLEPGERELEAIAAEMEAVEARLEGAGEGLAPFADRLETIHAEMEPIERQLEAVARELEPTSRELEKLSAKLEVLTAEEAADAAELDAVHQEMARLHESMEPIHQRMGELHDSLEPLHQRLRAVHDEARPTHEELAAIHRELEPFHQRMAEVHARMEPVHEEMRRIHREMEPVHQRMTEVHRSMTPAHEELAERHQRMEPVHRQMHEIHQRMEPVHRQMAELHEEVRAALGRVVADVLADQLGSLLASGTPLDEAAERVLRATHVHIDDGRLRLRGSTPELAAILTRALEPARTGEPALFAAAVERAARALTELEIAVPSVPG